MPIPVPVELDPIAPASGGVLAQSSTLPAGWQRGISFTDNNCLGPVVMGECPTTAGLKPGQRPDAATFRPVSLIQAVECTTRSNLDTSGIASDALAATHEFALARELLTGEASARDAADQPNGGNPALVNTATDLGAAFPSVAAAFACLEQHLAEANFGRGGVILVSPAMATFAVAERVLWRDGARWRTGGGSVVIVSPGLDGRAPVADGVGAPPAPGAALYAYAVTAVWAETGEGVVIQDVERSVNTTTSRAEEIALAAFSTCAVFAAASTEATAC